jgi:hypothetical protein
VGWQHQWTAEFVGKIVDRARKQTKNDLEDAIKDYAPKCCSWKRNSPCCARPSRPSVCVAQEAPSSDATVPRRFN